MKQKPHPSDLTDQEWAILEPMIPPAKPGGRPRTADMREVVNAIFYVLKTGCRWDMLPDDFPPKGTVYHYYNTWRKSGAWSRWNRLLREEMAGGEENQTTPGTVTRHRSKPRQHEGHAATV